MSTVEGLEELYREKFGRFCQLATAVIGDSDLARDAVQTGFARALAGAGTWRREGSLEGWVWRIVLNSARDARSGPTLDQPVADVPRIVDERDPALAEALRSLSPRRRLVVFLHYYADLPYAEIAEILGVERGTVAATLSQARDALRLTMVEEEVER